MIEGGKLDLSLEDFQLHVTSRRPSTDGRPAAVDRAVALDPAWQHALIHPSRKIAFYAALAYVFFRFSMAHELVTYLTGINTYVLYMIGPAALIGALLSGGLQRVFRVRTAFYYLGFVLLLFPATLFSSWIGGSSTLVMMYVRTEAPALLFIAGTVMTWRECQLVMKTIAAGAIVNVLIGRIFIKEGAERLTLDFGSIANSNDYATQLLLVIPFVLYVVVTTKSVILRLAGLGVIGYGLYLILQTGSRGGLLGVAAALGTLFILGTNRYRLAFLAFIPVAALILAATPDEVMKRLKSFTASGDEVSAEAIASSESRKYLFKKSMEFTVTKPLFGVGPGEFANFEGRVSKAEGRRGNWHSTHNSFTQISSECGIPAALLYVATLIGSIRLTGHMRRAAKAAADTDKYTALLAFTIAIIGFFVAFTFVSFGYKFYTPAIAGLAIAMFNALQHEGRRATPGSIPATPRPAWRSPVAPGASRPASRR